MFYPATPRHSIGPNSLPPPVLEQPFQPQPLQPQPLHPQSLTPGQLPVQHRSSSQPQYPQQPPHSQPPPQRPPPTVSSIFRNGWLIFDDDMLHADYPWKNQVPFFTQSCDSAGGGHPTLVPGVQSRKRKREPFVRSPYLCEA